MTWLDTISLCSYNLVYFVSCSLVSFVSTLGFILLMCLLSCLTLKDTCKPVLGEILNQYVLYFLNIFATFWNKFEYIYFCSLNLMLNLLSCSSLVTDEAILIGLSADIWEICTVTLVELSEEITLCKWGKVGVYILSMTRPPALGFGSHAAKSVDLNSDSTCHQMQIKHFLLEHRYLPEWREVGAVS